jgi:hypothetical protein
MFCVLVVAIVKNLFLLFVNNQLSKFYGQPQSRVTNFGKFVDKVFVCHCGLSKIAANGSL